MVRRGAAAAVDRLHKSHHEALECCAFDDIDLECTKVTVIETGVPVEDGRYLLDSCNKLGVDLLKLDAFDSVIKAEMKSEERATYFEKVR